MTNAESLVQVLADHLHGRESSVAVTPMLLEDAGRHEVEAIVYRQTRAAELEKNFFAAVYMDRKRRRVDQEVRRVLAEGGIDCFSVKGLFAAQFYPAPALRTMGDLDFVASDRPKARALLEKAGYVFREEAEASDWHFSKNGVELELHDRLLYAGRLDSSPERMRYFNDCWQYCRDGELDPNFHFLFLVVHLRKHMLGGVGFRQFLDFAAIAKNGPERFDWEWIKKELEATGLLPFAEVCLGLCGRWFLVEPPFAVPPVSDAFLAKATRTVYENGIFGFDNEDNTKKLQSGMSESTEAGFQAVAGKRLLSRAFPSYEEMTLYPEYHFLEGKKFLTPVAWVYRFSRNALKMDKWKKLRRETVLTEEEFSARNEELREWGM